MLRIFFAWCQSPHRMLVVILLAIFPLGVLAEDGKTPFEVFSDLMQLGQASLSEGDPKQGEAYFSQALRLAPGSLRAQLSLAEAFARQKQVRRAEAYLRHLLLDPARRANSAAYLAAIRILQDRYPVTGAGSFAILPSTNVANASSSPYFDTLLGRFTIENGGNAVSGIGVEVSGQGSYRFALDDGLSLELGGAVSHTWYDAPELRLWQGRVTVDIRRLTPVGESRVGLHYDRTFYPDIARSSPDRTATGVHGSWSWVLDARNRIAVYGLTEFRDYLNRPSFTGPFGKVGLNWSRRIGDSGTLTLGASVERLRPRLDYHRYWGGDLRAGYEQNLTRTLRGGLSMRASFRQYDTDFAAVNFSRKDVVYRPGLSLSDSRIKVMGGTPKLSCEYQIQNSNIALYTMSSVNCRIGWSYRF
ncbi:surface lipoprotein assembly modifier [Pseudooceanicola algae]|uniref:Surface lipoprotein assembly modifier C-terminal domain-containing protein n=1 Tax=Pseudooceanicola algae TaxID=1537215 RepID=A0A418SCE2_9RHOB|nr:surface lipoprotein assembly modifier [Pseudooceanicola algae]QPM90064.1 hypothetical protein PSAL_012970 [Pseudooceanicola algae]